MSSRKNWHMFRTCLNRSQLGKRRHKWPRFGKTMSLSKTQGRVLIRTQGLSLVERIASKDDRIVETSRVAKVSRTKEGMALVQARQSRVGVPPEVHVASVTA